MRFFGVGPHRRDGRTPHGRGCPSVSCQCVSQQSGWYAVEARAWNLTDVCKVSCTVKYKRETRAHTDMVMDMRLGFAFSVDRAGAGADRKV